MRFVVRLVDIRWGHRRHGDGTAISCRRGHGGVGAIERVIGALAVVSVHGEGTDQQSQHYGDSHEWSMHQ
jgi:hypothetical protein